MMYCLYQVLRNSIKRDEQGNERAVASCARKYFIYVYFKGSPFLLSRNKILIGLKGKILYS